ncbi:MAG: STAS domain-containing protein [Victivallaceae bacterium]|jgi:anti-sigma B factor antagonist|nr:STAS domain-containing protein [Victivallaceae bacterium]MDD3116918.1 STAS domain-containing protein [Victivallaceae bacterium]MDD4317192.1 STAS domain-containing protein [Victivallaceae bacterium]MDD5663283.1 STAS domain-containing protein [Victivallaceae bacterium]
MEINAYEESGVKVIELSGRLDAENAEKLRTEFLLFLEKNRNFVINCSNLEYLDSTGLGAMVFCMKSSNEYGGVLRLANLTPKVQMIFEITRAYRVFEIYDSLDAAIAAFSG